MESTHEYPVNVKWINEKRGMMSSPELDLALEVATPPPFPGGIERVWSPEHLLVASVNSCLMTTFLAIAENSKLKFHSFESSGTCKVEKVEGRLRVSEITLRPVVLVDHPEESAKAARILEKAESNCLISLSVTSRIIFEPTVGITAKSAA
jgi:organic hydroperoxide reductase OsmC/OhrA